MDQQNNNDVYLSPMVQFEKVNKSFGAIHVLKDFDFEVAPCEKVAIIGPSGSGKTTLLRVLMTLEKPDSGFIKVDNELLWHQQLGEKIVAADEKHLHRVRGKIGMVFQLFNLFPHMNVLRNVTEAPIRVLGIKQAEAKDRALDLLEMVGLVDKVDAYPSQLSGGQQQRVAIARALAMQPKVMLFDEITSALDPELVGEVLNVVRKLAHEFQMTMLIVTHEMNFASDVADRVIFIDEGSVIEEGSPSTMFTNPSNPRTRAFLKEIIER